MTTFKHFENLVLLTFEGNVFKNGFHKMFLGAMLCKLKQKEINYLIKSDLFF